MNTDPTLQTAQWFAGACRLSVMQFSQVAEWSERQKEKSHLILSRDNGISKFRFSVCRASPHMHYMLRDTTSPRSKTTGIVAKAAFNFVSGFRLMARLVSCYVRTVHERN